MEQIAGVIVAIGFFLAVDNLTCQPVIDIVDILLLDIFRRSGQPILRLVVAESLRIGWIFCLFQAVQAVIGVDGLARKLTFLNSLAVAVVAVGVLRKDFFGRGYL